jgi:DNA-binding PadR family transcriptional regulator
VSTRAVLAALAEDPSQWRHGYSVMKETQIHSGTLYPIFQRLEQSGLLESKWEDPLTSGRPARHLYRLTAPGLERARLEVARATDNPELQIRFAP